MGMEKEKILKEVRESIVEGIKWKVEAKKRVGLWRTKIKVDLELRKEVIRGLVDIGYERVWKIMWLRRVKEGCTYIQESLGYGRKLVLIPCWWRFWTKEKRSDGVVVKVCCNEGVEIVVNWEEMSKKDSDYIERKVFYVDEYRKEDLGKIVNRIRKGFVLFQRWLCDDVCYELKKKGDSIHLVWIKEGKEEKKIGGEIMRKIRR